MRGLTLCMLGNFACFFFFFRCLWIFFLNQLFQKNLSGIPSECQTVWIQIRPDVLSNLIRFQTVCKGYQQTTKVATSGERVKVTMTKHAPQMTCVSWDMLPVLLTNICKDVG